MKGLFLRFYRGHEKMANQFANKLPECKLSMAKLQGHFLKYRDQPQAALDNAKKLLEDDE